ncbi:cache domain-containing protein [Mucilaginibacter arboris]|uniref:Cache domain-containing protein n=1 Tax=Mucilaginibacter arboris TaxID=2682090 RepID=A0A7K1SYR7_9SPHI|nr:cache domain-containing protein [Mucilaginibacter arboris]MVN22451.1 hypothetical protein [Mucilaginibacter arboris]
MKSFFSSGKGMMAIFGTVLVIVFLGASYMYVYIPIKERRIREQGFRAMQNIDRNIQSKIQNSVSLLNNLLSAYISKSKLDTSIQGYIKKNTFGSFKLTPIEPVNASDFKKIFSSGSDSAYNIAEDIFAQQYILNFYKKRAVKEAYKISMKVDVVQFFKPLMPNDVLFDEYVVFSGKKTVYQTFQSGLSEVKPDSLLSKKNGIKGANILTREIGGTVYQIFLQPVGFTTEGNLIIAGLLTDEKYQYEKKQLPPGVVQLLIIIAIGIIILFPGIKLYHMGSQDRLALFDAVSSIAISMLLMSLLFFCLFKYNVRFRQLKTNDSKDVIADKIVAAFKKEINLNYRILKDLDLLAYKNKSFHHDIGEIGKKNNLVTKASGKNPISSPAETNFKSQIQAILEKEHFPKTDFNQVYWLDQYGQELFKWDSLKYNGPHGNYAQRSYVKNILVNKAYLLNGDPAKPYYLDQIISWTTGVFTTVISRPSILSTADSNIVEALAFNMKCLDRVILPAGYGFAMIDWHGKVLYHADKNRNLNENLLQEFSKHEELQSCIESHSQKSFSTAYLGKDYIVKVKPIKGLPYLIAVFSDNSFIDTRDIEIYCFTLAMLFAFFCFLVLELATVFLVSSTGSYFKKQHFSINWIGPKASFHHYYILSSIFNITVILLLNFTFKVSTFAEFFFMLLFSATAILTFLICLFARRYQKENDSSLLIIKQRAIWALVVFIGLINLLACISLDQFTRFFSFETIALIMGIGLFVFGDYWIKILGKIGANLKKRVTPFTLASWNHVHSFTLMILTRLIITSGIPVVLFYVMAYNYEQNLLIRYRHYDFAHRLIEKEPNADKPYLNDIKNGTSGVYTDNSWISSVAYSAKSDTVQNYLPEEKLTINMLKFFHFYRDSSAIRENHLYQYNAEDSSFFYNHLYKGPLKDTIGTKTFVQNPYKSGYIKVQSKTLNYRFPSFFKNQGIPFWLLMLLLLLIFYRLILSIIEKLFTLKLPETEVWDAIDKEVLLCKDLNKMLMVIGLPGSNKLSYVLSKISSKELKQDDGGTYIYDRKQTGNNNVLLLDLIQIPDNPDPASEDNTRWKKIEEGVFSNDYKLVLINHFEYNIKDETTNRIKLNLLERLMVENKCKIIIFSTIHPTAFLDSLNAQAEEVSGKSSSVQDKSTAGKASVQDLDRWHILLGHYRLLIHPIEHKDFDRKLPDWQQTIVKETQYTHFLNNMQAAAIQATRSFAHHKIPDNSDSLAFKLQVTAHYFYMYIWQSLTKEEKFLLYDLAEDGLVNGFDAYNLSMLISKGVVVRDDTTLKLFNRGFRNFILTAIGNTEVRKIKSQMQDNGNWGKLKTPLLVVIFAILAFLLTSQQEAYSKLIAYVSALAAGIPAVIKLFSLFDTNSAQKSG